MSFSKQAMVLNYQTIFKANNGFELLNHVFKQASEIIFSKTGLTKIPSFKQTYLPEVFRTCAVVLGHHFMHFRFSWSVNLVYDWSVSKPRLPCSLGYIKQERPPMVDDL